MHGYWGYRMCIIVDANVVRDLSAPTEDGKPILNWLLRGRGALIVGGHLKQELNRAGLRSTLVTLDQAGRLRRLNDAKVQEMSNRIDQKCRSNDCHVVAAALVSGCRLIFTRDKNLQRDMKDREILTPTASIYQSKNHRHLLTDCHCH
jgi:rRNA-processing protein FCF1